MSEHTRGHVHAHSDLLPQLLAADAVVHSSLVDEAVGVIARYLPDPEVARVVDIGSGTGAGTFALAAAYPGAAVVAVDLDQEMLDAVRRRGDDIGIAGRIDMRRADVGRAGFDVGTADVIWSSNVIHEISDPATAFENMRRALRRGGVLVVIEMDSPPRVLPARCEPLETALRAAANADAPGPDWSGAIAAAGFDLLEKRSLASDQVLPSNGPGGTFAALELRRLAHHGLPTLGDGPAAELRELVSDLTGRHALLDQVHIRGTRTLWVARRL